MKAFSLRKQGKLVHFEADSRQSERGVYLLYQDEKEELILIVDEAGSEHHQQLHQSLPREFGKYVILGGGRYNRNVVPIFHHQKPWSVNGFSMDFGNIDEDLLKAVANIITGGEDWEQT